MIQAPTASASVDPIISRLRPRTVVEIIDQAFRLYRRHFLTFLAITAIVYVPVNLLIQAINVWLQGTASEMSEVGTVGGGIDSSTANEMVIALIIGVVALLALTLLGSILLYLSQGALTAAVADSHLDRPVRFGSAYRSTMAHLGPLVGVMILQILIYAAIFVPVILLFALAIGLIVGSSSGDAAGGAFGLMCFAFLAMIPTVVFFLYVTTRLFVIVPAMMVESLGPVQSLRRSWDLIKDYWWRTFALIVVLGIMSSIISAGPAYLVMAIVLLVFRTFDQVILTAVTGVVTVLTTLFFIPLQLIATTLYYFDQRVRKEGFDIETAVAQRYAPGVPPGYGQYAPATAGAMPPPTLGYGAQQTPAYTQQGYAYGAPTQPSPVAGGYAQPGPHYSPYSSYSPPSSGSINPPQPQEPPMPGYTPPPVSATPGSQSDEMPSGADEQPVRHDQASGGAQPVEQETPAQTTQPPQIAEDGGTPPRQS